MKKSVIILALLLGLLSACSKFDDLSAALEQQIGIASVAVFNGLPEGSSMELFVDGSKWNVNKISKFHNWPSGRRELKIVYRHDSKQEVFQGTIELEEGRFYSLFVHRDTEIRVTKQQDDPLRPKSGFAKIRIAHLSSQVPSFHVHSVRSDKFATSLKYKQISNFAIIPLEAFHIEGEVDNGSSTQIPDFDYKFSPDNQGVYTLIIRDVINGAYPSELYKIELIKQ